MSIEGGWDIAVHEPRTSINEPETILVYVAQDKIISDATKWHYLGEFSVEGTKDNLIRIEMGKIKFAYWVKIKDAGSMFVPEGVMQDLIILLHF